MAKTEGWVQEHLFIAAHLAVLCTKPPEETSAASQEPCIDAVAQKTTIQATGQGRALSIIISNIALSWCRAGYDNNSFALGKTSLMTFNCGLLSKTTMLGCNRSNRVWPLEKQSVAAAAGLTDGLQL